MLVHFKLAFLIKASFINFNTTMKKLIICLSVILFLTQCKKENNIKVKEVTQTDENCNVIGDPNPEQFQLKHLSEISTFDEGYFYGNFASTNFISNFPYRKCVTFGVQHIFN